MHLLALGLELAQESAQRLLLGTPIGEVLRNRDAEKYEFEMHCFKGDATKQNMVDNHKRHVATCRTVVI